MDGKLKYMREMFGGVPRTLDEKEKARVAFYLAHEIRMFEIDLYWKRALYFWGFQAAIFAGFALLVTNKTSLNYESLGDFLISLTAFAGLIMAIAWYYANKGSKAWQENWEGHIESLEYSFSGNLYRILTNKKEIFYSVSRINELTSLSMVLFWVIIAFLISFYTVSHIKKITYSELFDINPVNTFVDCLIIFSIVVISIKKYIFDQYIKPKLKSNLKNKIEAIV